MRIMIICFSGTGNTFRIAEILSKEFIDRGHSCQLLPMESITLGKVTPVYQDWDLIGLGFPVHAMDAPQIVYDLLDLLPKSRQAYFLFKSAGSAFLRGGSTSRIRLRLANLGWKLRHEQLYVMPPNAFGTAKQAKVDTRYYQSRDLAIRSVGEILDGLIKRQPEALFKAACYAFAALEKHGARQSSRRWIVSSSCNLCGLCASQCPTRNISIQDGKLQFSDKCLLCLRCWWNCSSRSLSHKLLGPFLLKEQYRLPQEPEL